jgi:hypothetical protein
MKHSSGNSSNKLYFLFFCYLLFTLKQQLVQTPFKSTNTQTNKKYSNTNQKYRYSNSMKWMMCEWCFDLKLFDVQSQYNFVFDSESDDWLPPGQYSITRTGCGPSIDIPNTWTTFGWGGKSLTSYHTFRKFNILECDWKWILCACCL